MIWAWLTMNAFFINIESVTVRNEFGAQQSQIPFGEFDDVETIASVQKLIWLNRTVWMIMLIFNGWFLEAN